MTETTTTSPNAFRNMIDNIFKEINAKKEEICRAFVAKYGCEPDEVAMVQTSELTGGISWHLELKPEAKRQKDSKELKELREMYEELERQYDDLMLKCSCHKE